jgi:hypothetical protein
MPGGSGRIDEIAVPGPRITVVALPGPSDIYNSGLVHAAMASAACRTPKAAAGDAAGCWRP